MSLKTAMANIKTFLTRDISLDVFDRWVDIAMFGGLDSDTGVVITESTALAITTVWSCVRAISEDVAKLPLVVYKRTSDGKEVAYDHPLYTILHDAPNSEMTSMEFRENLTAQLVLRGNAYAQIRKNGMGRVVDLWPLRADRMQVKRTESGALVYEYPNPGTDRTAVFTANEILHIRGMSPDGILGYSPITVHRNSLGLARSQEKFAGRFFKNAATPPLKFEHPGKLGDAAYARLKKAMNEEHVGSDNFHRAIIAEEGMKIEAIGLSNEDSQFIESREFQVPEIARIFRVPLHKIQHLKQATFSNIEHQAIEYVVDTLQSWCVRWEQRANVQLLTPEERKQGYFVEHKIVGLLRGASKERAEYYKAALGAGGSPPWMTQDEVRSLENMNAMGGNAAVLREPSNVGTQSQDEPQQA